MSTDEDLKFFFFCCCLRKKQKCKEMLKCSMIVLVGVFFLSIRICFASKLNLY